MKPRRAILLGLIVVLSVGSIAPSIGPVLPDGPERPPANSAEYVDSGISIYEYNGDETDHDADIWVSVKNTNDSVQDIRVEMTPILEGGSEHNTKTESVRAPAGDTERVEASWNSGSNKEESIESVKVTVYACNSNWLVLNNCREVDSHGW